MTSQLLSQEHTNAIGSLVVSVGKLESLATDLISIFAETDIISSLICVHHQSLSAKRDSLLALAKIKLGDDQQFQQIFDLLNEIKPIAEFRNTIVHGHWALGENGQVVTVRFTARGEFKRTRRTIDVKDIEDRAQQAEDLVLRLRDLRDSLQSS